MSTETCTDRPPVVYDFEFDAAPPSPADVVYKEILGRRDLLDRTFDTLVGPGVGEPTMGELPVEGPHRLLAFDLSDYPGGAFKYVSSRTAALTTKGRVKVAPSAGNYSGTLSAACVELDFDSIAYTPRDVNRDKVSTMAANGMDVRSDYDDVAHAIEEAEADCNENDEWAMLHPFNNPNGIAALTLLGDYVLDGLAKMEAEGGLNLRTDDVEILVQRGGGSLITALACKLKEAKEAGWVGPNVVIREVRPATVGGELDTQFDGLRVKEAGSYAQPILKDRAYVAGTYHVERPAVADATRRVAKISKVPYEPNSLIGIGAFEQFAAKKRKPTVFVALLTGRNGTPEQRDFFLGHPGQAEVAAEKAQVENERRNCAALAQTAFKAQSYAYMNREVRGMDEVHANNKKRQRQARRDAQQAPRNDDTTALLRREVKAPLYGGATAGYNSILN